MNFPAWAPLTLVKYYQSNYEDQEDNLNSYRDMRRKTLVALISNPKMEAVWKMLYKKRVSRNKDMAFFLFIAIVNAINETKQKITIRSEDILKYQKIAKAARELSDMVSDSRLDIMPMHWFPIEAISTMIEKDINPEKAAGYFCLVHDESDFHKKGGIYQEIKFKDLSGNDILEHWRIAENTSEFFKGYCITPQYPSISKILKSMAQDADDEAKHEAIEPRISNKSNTSTTTIFIRALYPFLVETFGSPLYRTFAGLCRVVLIDDSIGDNDIKDALRKYKISN